MEVSLPSIRRSAGLLALLLVLTASATGAQTEMDSSRPVVSGRVADMITGEPLSGASVYVVGSERGTATGENGSFSLTVDTSTVTLRVSYVGYRSKTIGVKLPREARLAIALQPDVVGLDEVNITVGRGESIVESPQMSVNRLPVKAIEKLPAVLGEVDVMKTIQMLPGVQSGTEGSTGLYVRGGAPAQNLILLDGVPVYNASHIFGFLSIFNSNVLEDVEIIKGGFPARYGGRLSSVVDIRMKEGSRKEYSAEGSIGLVASSLTVEGPIVEDRASFILSGRRTYIDLLAWPIIQRQMPANQTLTAYFYDLNGKLSVEAGARDKLSASFYHGNDIYGSSDETVTRDSGVVVRRDRYSGNTAWGNFTSTLNWKHFFSPSLFSEVTLLYTRYRFDIGSRFTHLRTGGSPRETFEEITYRSGIEDIGGRIDIDYQTGAGHYLRFGGRLVRHAFNPGVAHLQLNQSGEGRLDTTLTPNTYHFSAWEGYLYAEDEIDIADRLVTNLGLHASGTAVEGRTYTSLQPRLSLRFLASPEGSLKASFSTMEQYLHLLTNTGINMPTDLWVAATDEVEPQHAWQAALGTAYSAGDFEISLEGYYKQMRGLLEYEAGASFVAPHEDWQDKVVAGEGWSYGGELFIRKKSGRTTGWLGYTLAWSRRQFDALNGGEPFPYRYDRRHDISLAVSHKLSDAFNIGASWVYGTGQAVTLATARYLDGRLTPDMFGSRSSLRPQLRKYGPRGGYRMAPYHRLDVTLHYRFGGAFFLDSGESTLTLGAYNAYNRKNPFYLFAARDRQGNRVYKRASLFPVLPAISYRFEF